MERKRGDDSEEDKTLGVGGDGVSLEGKRQPPDCGYKQEKKRPWELTLWFGLLHSDAAKQELGERGVWRGGAEEGPSCTCPGAGTGTEFLDRKLTPKAGVLSEQEAGRGWG